MEELYENILKSIGEDANRSGLECTPKRAAEAMRYMTSGYSQKVEKVLNGAVFEVTNDDMVIVKNIEFYSLCEHHILPFYGNCSVGYIPNGKVIGLSKIPRIVDIYARRLQLQEKLTYEIAEAIKDAIDAKGVIVSMKAQHLCIMMRGIEKQESQTATIHIAGDINEKELDQFYKMLTM